MNMITVKIQGQEVQAALLNPSVTKKVEDGFNTVLKKFDEAKNAESGSEGIRMQCQSVIDYVEDIFGKSGAKKIFGEETDLLTCLDVMEEIQCMYETQVNPIIREKTNRIVCNAKEAGETE